MSLKNWLSNGWLTEHNSSRQEIGDLLAIAERDLEQALTPGLSPDWRLNIAYNAALQMAVAALAAVGFRAGRDNKYYRVIQSLAFTIGLDSDLVLLFDQFRKKRNISDYERQGWSPIKRQAKCMHWPKVFMNRSKLGLRPHTPIW